MNPGHQASGKYHNYFAKATPGSCILYIRDTEKNVILWTRPDPNAEEEEEITIDAPIVFGPSPSPEFVIPDASEDECVEVEVEGEDEPPAPLSGGQDPAEDVDVEVDEAPSLQQQMIMDAEEVPETPPPIATGGTHTIEMTAEDAAIISGEIPVTSIPPQPVTTPLALPAPSTGGRRRACPNCGFQHLVGQMLCLGCGASIIKASSQHQRHKVKTDRWFREEAAAIATIRETNPGSRPRSVLRI